MDFEKFNKNKTEGFVLLYAIYPLLYSGFILFLSVDYIIYMGITALFATLLAIYTIITKLELKIDTLFFNFRAEINNNIFNFFKRIWIDKIKNKNCHNIENCTNFISRNCSFRFDISNKEVKDACFGCFYNIIDNRDYNFEQTKSIIFQRFLYYYFCMITLFLSISFLLILNLTLFFRISLNELKGNKEMFFSLLIIQIFFFIFFILSQIRHNNMEKIKKRNILTWILFIIFLFVSFLFDYLILLMNIENFEFVLSTILFLIFIISFFILGFMGKDSSRIKEEIILKQNEQFIEFTNLENEEIVSNCIKKRICEREELTRYINEE